jgi:pyruvate formate-lyase/glycerol dehydratase family glycyl radical enzyme
MSQVTLKDLSLKEYELEDFGRLKRLQEVHFQIIPEMCIERSRLVTEYLKKASNGDDPPVLRQAKVLKYLLENKKPIICHTSGKVVRYADDEERSIENFQFRDDNLLAGTTTSKPKGVLLYPEFLALTMWPELLTVRDRETNPYYISDEDIERLNLDIFPFWMDKTPLEYVREHFDEPSCQRLMEKLVFFLCSKPYCISHTIPDYSRVVSRGLNYIIKEAEEKKSGADTEKSAFYEAIKLVLEGVIAYANNLSDEATKLAASETDADRKRELKELADICDRVPAEKPETFREGLNAVWICEAALHQENANIGFSIGRLDQVLFDLYQRDVNSGQLTVKEAIELIGCLWLKCADHVPMIPETAEALFGGTGSNQAITVGGITPDGEDAVNDLTYVMLKATELLKIRDPNVNARVHVDVNPPEYLRRLCEVNLNTGATPSMHNDLAAIPALENQGIKLEHARDYSSVGCVEPSSGGRTYGHTGSVLLNTTAALDLTLFNGKHRLTEEEQISPPTGDPEQFETFDEFMNAFETQLKWLLDQSVEMNNYLGKAHQALHPTPLLSALFEGPMDKGKDVIEGGALYNSTGVSITGLADVVDSISAIEKFVYQDRTLSMKDLLEALKSNFEGREDLKTMLQKKAPKFGTEDPVANKNAERMVEFLHSNYQQHTNYRGGKYTVGYWTMTMHAGFGMLMGATPNGREASESFSSGITPVSGATKALPACLNSVASLNGDYLANGVALNLKYTPDADRKLMLDRFSDTVEAYFRDGGIQVQFNIITRKMLTDIMEDPQHAPDVLVRVSGYTAYFKDLSEQMKREVINRSEYNLRTMEAQDYPWV